MTDHHGLPPQPGAAPSGYPLGVTEHDHSQPVEKRRDTKQRRAIRSAIFDAERPLSPAEIHEAAATLVEGIGQATVYRAIKDMLEAGEIDEVTLPGEPSRYERAGLDHHHHFHCTTCDRMYDVEGCPGSLSTLLPSGFTLSSHDITLYGTCADCAEPS